MITHRILSGSTISYGSVLPNPNSVADGSLFYLTTAYTDLDGSTTNQSGSNIDRTPGLHVFRMFGDYNSAVAGDQIGQIWQQLSSLTDFVQTAGDTMTGNLEFDSANIGLKWVTNTDTAAIYLRVNSPDSTDFMFELGDNGATNVDGFVWRGDSSGGGGITQDIMRLSANTGLTILGNTVWHAGNDGATSGLDADLLDGQHGLYYLNSGNHTGTIPTNRGGTGTTVVTTNGVSYGSSPSSYGFTAAGAAGAVLVSNASGIPAFSAAGIAGQLLQSSGAGVPTWVNSSSITVGSATTAGSLSPGFTIALSGDVTGSISTTGTGTATIVAAVVDNSHNHTNYVLKAGDTMTGSLTTTALAVGAVSVPVAGGINATSNIATSGNIISNGGNLVTNGGSVIAGSTGAGQFIGGNSAFGGTQSSPMFAFNPWSGTGGASNGLYMPGANEVRLVVAGLNTVIFNAATVTFNATIQATGDVLAYASDARLKKNVSIIPNALAKVKSLGGYEYDWDLEKTRRLGFTPSNAHEHGLLAQEVQKVLPDAVASAPFNSDYLTVKYDRLVALLIAGMNEQQAKIEDQQKQIEDQQAQMKDLREVVRTVLGR